MRVLPAMCLRGVLALVFTLALSGCGGDSDGEASPVAQVDAEAPPLHSFDIYGLASDRGNISQADVYGITLNPLRSYRLTADKRVSWLTADQDTIAVAAADERIDKLGFLADGGTLVAIPGLGRPHAFSPQIQTDGTIRYSDSGPGEAIISRYMSYDPETTKSRVLYETKDDLEIDAAAPKSGFLVVDRDSKPKARVLLMQADGSARSFSIAPRIASPESGKSLICVGIFGSMDVDAPPTDTALLDPKTGKIRVVEGWAPLGWTPDRTKVLVVRSADTRLPDSELAVLDPADPTNPQILGTIPGLTVFSASWVERSTSSS